MKRTRKKEVYIYAPLTGSVVSLDYVEDEMFSSRLLGDGIAIETTQSILLAPCDGIVTALPATNHAAGITIENQVELLLHVGLETKKHSEGTFTSHVSLGEHVQRGQTLLSFDVSSITELEKRVLVLLVFMGEKRKLKMLNDAHEVLCNEDVVMKVKL